MITQQSGHLELKRAGNQKVVNKTRQDSGTIEPKRDRDHQKVNKGTKREPKGAKRKPKGNPETEGNSKDDICWGPV